MRRRSPQDARPISQAPTAPHRFSADLAPATMAMAGKRNVTGSAAMLRVVLAAEPVTREGETPMMNQINEKADAGSRQRAKQIPRPSRKSAPATTPKTGRPGIV